MHFTIEAIVHPDGRVELLEPITTSQPRRALVALLDESPGEAIRLAGPSGAQTDAAIVVEDLLVRSGVVRPRHALPAGRWVPGPDELAARAKAIPLGTPLSQIVLEDREERF